MKKLAEKSALLGAKPNVVIKDSLTIKYKLFKGNDRYTRSYLLGKLKLRNPEKISYHKFLDGVTNLVATNNFEFFRYNLEPTNNEDAYTLNAKLLETPNTTFLRFGLHYDDLYKSAALVNFTKRDF